MEAHKPDIPVRDVSFDLDPDRVPRYWHGGRRAVSLFFDNLSTLFPLGERFFIKGVSHYRGRITDAELLEEVRGFTAQEAVHTREHEDYNDRLRGLGHDVDALEIGIARLLTIPKLFGPLEHRIRLGATAALEHWTGMFAHTVLLDDSLLAGAHPTMAALWRWHAAEECEHKAVAFDVYEHIGGDPQLRKLVMAMTTAFFWGRVAQQQYVMMREDGIEDDLYEWWDLIHYYFIEQDAIGRLGPLWRAYFDDEFHPWNLDDSLLIERWRREHAINLEYRKRAEPSRMRRVEPRVELDFEDPGTPLRPVPDMDVAIVGAGFSGLGMAIELRKHGVDGFAVFERGEDVGGTWRENTYPGCACDVPSHLYSYSFAQNPSWSRRYAPQPEILDYLRRCAEEHDVLDAVELGCEVSSAKFDESSGAWTVELESGRTTTARHLVLGVGGLHRPNIPEIPGLEEFEGATFHTATWDHSVDLSGKRVVVIGTGASAIQVVPQLAGVAEHLTVVQRTPAWVLPKPDGDIGWLEKSLYRKVPGAQRLYRWLLYWMHEAQSLGFTGNVGLMNLAKVLGLKHLERKVRDPAIREKLTPNYTPGCKRIILSNDFYPVFNRVDVDLVTRGIARVEPDGVLFDDGRFVPADIIVFGTGFKVTEPLPRGTIFGRGGLDIVDAWADRLEAYKGTTVSGFPNMYILMGPNTGLGHNSMVFMIEAQIEYARRAIEASLRGGGLVLEVESTVQAAYMEELTPRFDGTVWASGCTSWYLDAAGHNSTVWPGATAEFWRRTRRFDIENYHITRQ